MKVQTLKSILAFCILNIAFSIHSSAQIVYTDVNPDVTSTGTYNLDLNNDGSTDFVIKHTSQNANGGQCSGSQTNHEIKVTASGNNATLISSTDIATKLAPYAIIDASALTWNSNPNQIMTRVNWSCVQYQDWYSGNTYYNWAGSGAGQWNNAVDGILGLKLISGNNNFYGWVRISTVGASSFTIKDYAYNSTAGQSILAGQFSPDYITVAPTIATPVCASGNVSVPFTIYGTFNAANVVTAELSNANGSFASPVTIGSVVSNVSGSISAIIPALTPTGTGYRIRVTTTNSARISYANANNITVSTLMPAGTIVVNGSTNLCEGNVSLSTSSAAGYTYQWKLNGNNISGATSYSYSAPVAGDYSCVKSTLCASMTTNVITVPPSSPFAMLITAPAVTTVCGGSVALSTASKPGNSYQWYLNSTGITGATSSYYNASVTGNYYCVRTNSCGSATSNTISVTVNPLPSYPTLSASPAAVSCAAPVTLTSNAVSGLTFQWYNSSGIITGATGSTYAANTSDLDYRLVVTNTYGCQQFSSSISVEVGTPVALIYPQGSASVCNGNPVGLSVSPYYGPYFYQWMRNGIDISGATTSYYETTKAGSYSAKVTLNPGSCFSISSVTVVTKGGNGCRVADEDITNESEYFNIYPNPVSNSTIISFSLSQSEKVSLKIFDMRGRLVSTLVDKIFEAGKNELVWNAEEVNAGIYFLQFQSVENLQTEKLIVTK